MTIKAKKAISFWQKTKGLLGENKPYPLYLRTRWGIHTFGMNFPIDVVILDDSCTIRKIKDTLQPQKIFFWNPRYQHVVELPNGFVVKHRLLVGQQLMLTF